jgi:hypothetical protein
MTLHVHEGALAAALNPEIVEVYGVPAIELAVSLVLFRGAYSVTLPGPQQPMLVRWREGDQKRALTSEDQRQARPILQCFEAACRHLQPRRSRILVRECDPTSEDAGLWDVEFLPEPQVRNGLDFEANTVRRSHLSPALAACSVFLRDR